MNTVAVMKMINDKKEELCNEFDVFLSHIKSEGFLDGAPTEDGISTLHVESEEEGENEKLIDKSRELTYRLCAIMTQGVPQGDLKPSILMHMDLVSTILGEDVGGEDNE